MNSECEIRESYILNLSFEILCLYEISTLLNI